jgi:tyrosine-protein phosphatase SIW14
LSLPVSPRKIKNISVLWIRRVGLVPALQIFPSRLISIKIIFVMQKNFVIILFLLFAYAMVYPQKTAIVGDLPNFTRIDDILYRGGRPTEEGIKQLKAQGIKTVINLRNNKDDGAQEETWAKAAGLNFYNIPLNIWFRPKNARMNKIMAIIGEKENQPVYVHCNLGADRTGMVVAIYRISHDGWSADQANVEAKNSGLGKWQFWMRDYIKDYYRDFAKAKK